MFPASGGVLPRGDSETRFPSILRLCHSLKPGSPLHSATEGRKAEEGAHTSNCLGSEVVLVTCVQIPLVKAGPFNPAKCKGDWELQSWLGSHLPVTTLSYKRMNYSMNVCLCHYPLGLKADTFNISGQEQCDLCL